MIYIYECTTCAEMTELNLSISSDKPATILCEKCGGLMRRTYQAPAIKYKGDGWYTKDQWTDPNEDLDA